MRLTRSMDERKSTGTTWMPRAMQAQNAHTHSGRVSGKMAGEGSDVAIQIVITEPPGAEAVRKTQSLTRAETVDFREDFEQGLHERARGAWTGYDTELLLL